jgi:hypothetical protein
MAAAISATISVRVIPCVLSKTYLTFQNGIVKEGQPQCASNFELLSNNGSEQAPQQ